VTVYSLSLWSQVLQFSSKTLQLDISFLLNLLVGGMFMRDKMYSEF
jgi:hypothetical protein